MHHSFIKNMNLFEFLDPSNMGLDTKIIFIHGLLTPLWQKPRSLVFGYLININ